LRYHRETKHHFSHFARGPGRLDWANQPDPFRRYEGASLTFLPRLKAGDAPVSPRYEDLYRPGAIPSASLSARSLSRLLEYALAISAWKQAGDVRWALRSNPSSGNLHPTEAYLIRNGRVSHYAPREHALEERCVFADEAPAAFGDGQPGFLVALTSIHWREAWKYGERAFRYCQHDAGHAIAALRFSAAMLGWRVSLLPWSDAAIAAALGLDRDDDFADAEREEPECIAVVTPRTPESRIEHDADAIVSAARAARWSGHANKLSPSRVEWPIIDDVAQATRRVDRRQVDAAPRSVRLQPDPPTRSVRLEPDLPTRSVRLQPDPPGARQIILQRRSAVAFDARSTLPRDTFLSMLARTQPTAPPWDAIDWPPHVHLLLFVHRVEGLTPGVYACLRDPAVLNEWRDAMRAEFLWEPVNDSNESNDPNGLYLLLPFDVTWVANRVSCDQDIAADGFFSLGMIARLESSIHDREWFYRRLFWESGIIGQTLYLEAEAAGARSTGIGCFYDDPVHEAAGLSGREWQSLYHFSMGVPVEDDRLTTEPGYEWEREESGRSGKVEEVEK